MTRPYYTARRRSLIHVLLVCIVAAFIYWNGPQTTAPVAARQLLQGATMGTTYSIKYAPGKTSPTLEEMDRLIDAELKSVNLLMSTYIKESEISRFNDFYSTDWFSVSGQTAQVVELAQQISAASGGAFDVTVGPLVDLWGFGPVKRQSEPPGQDAIDQAKVAVGFQQLHVRLDPPAIRKDHPAIRIDLSAIAKGYGSDRAAHVLRSNGVADYFVEIGGEIVARGAGAHGKSWRVGIEAPLDYERDIQTIVELSDAAIATSGDYRNFYERDGQRFSHTIDPKTGRPVEHQLASASVVADNCALADAVATCMMVLGPEKGLELAEKMDWAVLLVRRHEDRLLSSVSTRFARRFPEVCKQLETPN